MKKWYGVVIISMVMAGTAFAQEISADQESKLTAINLEYVQKEKKKLEFKVIEKVGKANNLQYKVKVYIDEKAYGIGQDFTIKKAEQNAAEKALKQLFNNNID